MIFSAGIGIGIFFYGVAEPICHQNLPEALSTASDFDCFKVMFLHWGFHAWAVYALLAVGLAYFAYNRKLPFAAQSMFYPLLKDRIYGLPGSLIGTLFTVSILFGLAASLGLGTQQVNSGLSFVFGIPYSTGTQLIFIIIITAIATLAVASGVDRGMKWLSEANMIISGVLLLAILLLGPTSYIISAYLSGMGLYIKDFAAISLFSAVKPEDIAWQGQWTVFFWAWWFAFAPFVGIFIAEISEGRTIRQVTLGVVAVPTLAITVAMCILGGAGVFLDREGGGLISAVISEDMAHSIFKMFQLLTRSRVLQIILSVTAVAAICTFFLTSSDSGSLVVSNMTSGGSSNPSKFQRIFWSVIQGCIAVAVLLIGGGRSFETIQSAVIMLGLPFAVVLLVLMYSLHKGLREERGIKTEKESSRGKTVNAGMPGQKL
jgi:choline/carnitine/betaine transport